jgi:hypothetical protein
MSRIEEPAVNWTPNQMRDSGVSLRDQPEIYEFDPSAYQPRDWAPPPIVVESRTVSASPPESISASNPQMSKPAVKDPNLGLLGVFMDSAMQDKSVEERSAAKWAVQRKMRRIAWGLWGFVGLFALFVIVLVSLLPESPDHHLREDVDPTTQRVTVTLTVDVDYNKMLDIGDSYMRKKSLAISREVYGIAKRKSNVSTIHVVAHGSLTVVDGYGHKSRQVRDFDLEDYDASEVRKYDDVEYFDDHRGVQVGLHFSAFEAFPALRRALGAY